MRGANCSPRQIPPIVQRAGFAQGGQRFEQFFDQFDALFRGPAETFGDFFRRGSAGETGQGSLNGGGLFGKFLGPGLRFGLSGFDFLGRRVGHGEGGLLLAAGVLKFRPQPADQTPAFFRGLVSANEYDSLGEDFEKKENELFGAEGFEKMVDKVAGIEKKLGIYDLAQFTPKG